MHNLTPAHIKVDREDYNWMLKRFGNPNGVRPGAGQLTKRMRALIMELEMKQKEVENDK